MKNNVNPPAARAVTANHQRGVDGGVSSPDSMDHLVRLAGVVDTLGGELLKSDDIGSFAIELAVRGWRVLPLRGKVPAIRGGRGVHDATSDPLVVARWWGGPYTGCNIGARVPDSMFVLDIDPRNGGGESLTRLERRYGVMGDTLAVVSGRGDGGVHRYYRRPPGSLVSKHLGSGIDIKTSTGYCVMPPSIHPDSGCPYRWSDAEVGSPPQWLIDTMRPEQRTTPSRARSAVVGSSRPGVADAFCRDTTWGGVLEPHGWRCVLGDGDSDGSRWLHPAATSVSSATVRNGCLFVYSPNTRFDVTEASDPHGYTKFRAFALLNHDGDMSQAARELMRKAV